LRITLARDGKEETVEVAPGGDLVTVGGHRYPVAVVSAGPLRVELEIAGERVVVEPWPEHFPQPPQAVDVNGERWTVRVTRDVSAAGPPPAPRGPAPTPGAAPPAAAPAPAGGVAVLPPMPGRIIEVKVADGARVRKGDVLLVLEAMKMRNEVASPADGVVARLAVQAGTNVRAREPMLYVVPG